MRMMRRRRCEKITFFLEEKKDRPILDNAQIQFRILWLFKYHDSNNRNTFFYDLIISNILTFLCIILFLLYSLEIWYC